MISEKGKWVNTDW